MKLPLLVAAALCLSFLAQAQNGQPALRRALNTGDTGRVLGVTMSNDNLVVTYEGRPTGITTSAGLDSLLKKIPDLPNLHVEFSSYDSDREKTDAIGRILGQCNCPTKSMAMERKN